MHRKKILSTAALVAGLVGLGAAAAPSGAEPAEKVRVCHGTASETNPYVEIEVSARSLKDGHLKDGVGQAHGQSNNPDYLPADGEACDGSTTTTSSTTTTRIGEQ